MPAVSLSRKDLVLLAVLTLIWGVNWPVMKAGVRDFPPLTFRTLCMWGGLVLLAAMARSQGHSLRIARRHWRELLLLGLTNMVVWYVLSIWGVKLLSSGRAAILGYTMPVWTALWGWLLYRDRLDVRAGLGILAAGAAVLLLLGSELATLAGRPAGTLAMLGAAAVWGLGTQWMRRRTVPGSVIVLTFWMMLLSALVCTAIAWTFERDHWVRPPDRIEWAAVVFNVVLVFGAAQLLWFRLATILPPVASSLSVMLIPVVGLFSGMAMLGEVPTWHDWAALGFVLVAIGSVLLPSRRAQGA
jgi:drug/metabolite transporter (DMT)-like permease